MKIALIVLAVLLIIALMLGSSFIGRRNQMAVKREAVNAAWAQVDVVLQRRADLIPNLVENENFLRLQDELAGTENRIAVERRRYNETVQDYNTFIALFPNSLVASMSGFARNDAYFKTEEGARVVPKVSFGTPNAPATAPQPAPAKP